MDTAWTLIDHVDMDDVDYPVRKSTSCFELSQINLSALFALTMGRLGHLYFTTREWGRQDIASRFLANMTGVLALGCVYLRQV